VKTTDAKEIVKAKTQQIQSGNGDKYKTLQDLLKRMQGEIQKALPKHMDADRFARIAFTEVRRNPKLLECSQGSFLGALMMAAQVGLEPGPLGFCDILPYENKKTGEVTAQFQIRAKGFVNLMYRSGEVTSVSSNVVYEKDEFEFEYGINEKLRHVPKFDGDRGGRICVYAIAHFKDGGHMYVVLPPETVQKIRRKSKTPNYGPWVDWEDEMWVKTALKRLSKYAPLSPELMRKLELDETTKTEIKEDMSEVPDETEWIEVDATAIEDIPEGESEISEEKKGSLTGLK
jgi:recombination protein RecT